MSLRVRKRWSECDAGSRRARIDGSLQAGRSVDDSEMNRMDRIIGQAILAILRAHRLDVAPVRLAALTRQLLASSRGALSPQVLDLNEIVRSMEKMLARVMGDDIHLCCTLDPRLDTVRADPGQMRQALMSLAVNARNAMPAGGKLTIETANAELGEEYCRTHPEIRPGSYVMLAATDTGTAMTDEARRLCDPAFAARESGQGTGLAAVFGIVKQCEGSIAIQSQPGVSTSLRIYLPRLESGKVPRGTETILLVESDHAVRALNLRALRLAGFIVLEAASGAEALRLAADFPETIHLIVTDAVSPGADGCGLAEQLQNQQPSIKVLYGSEFCDNAAIRAGIQQDRICFLQKPFSPAALVRKVRELLPQ